MPMPAARAPLHSTALAAGRGSPWAGAVTTTHLWLARQLESPAARGRRGTLLVCKSSTRCRGARQGVDGVGRPVTFENPRKPTIPPRAPSTTSRKWSSGSAIKALNMRASTLSMPTRTRVRRPTRSRKGSWARLPGLGRLSATCRCPKHVGHPSVVAEAAKDSASYPSALCRAYAKLLVAAWKASAPAGAAAAATEAPTLKRKAPAAGEASENDPRGHLAGRRWQICEPPGTRQQEGQEGQGEQGGHWGHAAARAVLREGFPGLRAVGMETDLLFDKVCRAGPRRCRGERGIRHGSFVIKHWASGGRSWKHISA